MPNMLARNNTGQHHRHKGGVASRTKCSNFVSGNIELGGNLRSTKAFATAIRLDYRFRYLLLREAWYQRLACWERVATNTYYDKHPLLDENFPTSTYSPESEPTRPLDLGAPHLPIIDPSGGSGNSDDEDISDVWLTDMILDDDYC